MEIPLPGGVANAASDLTASINPLASQLGHLSLQDRAFLDVFNRQEQQELQGALNSGSVDAAGLLGQLEQAAIAAGVNRSHNISDEERRPGHPRHHEVVSELASEEVRKSCCYFLYCNVCCKKCKIMRHHSNATCY